MTERPRNERDRLRFGPLLRVLLPSLVTLVLVVLLVFTMFFTEFDWQWITFLAGILFASVLALISASLKSGWRSARRAAEVAHVKQRLSAEIAQHRGTREQLERELALHQQDRTRLAREIEAHRLALEDKLAAETMLEQSFQETAAAAPADADRSAAGAAQHATTKLVIAGESGNAVYLSSLTEELTGWGNPRERIRQAIQSDGFDLYAQDIVALRTDAASKPMQELLIRMRDEEQNLVPPGTFLPIAERFGMMPDIDRFVVRKAIAARAAAARLSADAADFPLLCINLARASIEDRSFPEFVVRALEQNRISGQTLCFEIADSDAIACLPDASRFAHELKPLGCRFTLDGFGRSGIGFDHVKALPLDFLKIDGSIILQIVRVPEALAKVRAIQRVCKVIGIRTIAEMVESEDSRERLRAVEVDYVQGFGIAKPHPF